MNMVALVECDEVYVEIFEQAENYKKTNEEIACSYMVII
jgi:hypothetical protein